MCYHVTCKQMAVLLELEPRYTVGDIGYKFKDYEVDGIIDTSDPENMVYPCFMRSKNNEELNKLKLTGKKDVLRQANEIEWEY